MMIKTELSGSGFMRSLFFYCPIGGVNSVRRGCCRTWRCKSRRYSAEPGYYCERNTGAAVILRTCIRVVFVRKSIKLLLFSLPLYEDATNRYHGKGLELRVVLDGGEYERSNSEGAKIGSFRHFGHLMEQHFYIFNKSGTNKSVELDLHGKFH